VPFRFNTTTNALATYQFQSAADGQEPVGGVIVIGGKLFGTTIAGGASGAGSVFEIGPKSMLGSLLYSFSEGPQTFFGPGPGAGLTSIGGANLFGTTRELGAYGLGTLFKLTTNGQGYQVVYSFAGAADGALPLGQLLLNGTTLYGTTIAGGTGTGCNVSGISGWGTVFSIALSGDLASYKILHNF
jgi:uncharacterized repeat protein (TIGR03803 family)